MYITYLSIYVKYFFYTFRYNEKIIFSMRTIFIGDVHGCLLELQDLIDKLVLTPEDRVILL